MIRLANILKEADELNSVLTKIEKATDRNSHAEALDIIAKFLNDSKTQKILKAITDIHHLEGGMPKHLQQYRDTIMHDLLDKVESKHGKDAKIKINSVL